MKSIWWWVVVSLAGCATGGSKDQGPWAGQPVAALDSHPYLQTLPMVKMVTAGGGEVRNYQSRANTYQCYTEGGVRAGQALSQNAYGLVMECTGRSAGCDHVFTVRDGKVLTYSPNARLFDARSCAIPAPMAGSGPTPRP